MHTARTAHNLVYRAGITQIIELGDGTAQLIVLGQQTAQCIELGQPSVWNYDSSQRNI